MRTRDSTLKTLMLCALVAAGGAVHGQNGEQWYGGRSSGFWGLSQSVGVRGALPGMFNPPGTDPDSFSAQRQYGGYRITDAFAVEGAQTHFGPSASSCGGDSPAADAYRSCSGAAWSLSGVATLPFQSGLSLYGRLGLNYRQKTFQEEPGTHRSADEAGGFGTLYGVGLSYGVTKSITVHAETERYSELLGNGVSGANSGLGLDASVHSIGLSIKF